MLQSGIADVVTEIDDECLSDDDGETLDDDMSPHRRHLGASHHSRSLRQLYHSASISLARYTI
eukprot:1192199-Prorocentrum_minimum.AAC.7